MACRNLFVFTLAVFCNIYLLNAQGKGLDYSYRDHELLVKGDSLINNDQWNEAIKSFTIAGNYFNQEGNLRALIYAYGKMAFCYMQKDDYRSAFRVLSDALKRGKHLNDPTISEIGIIYSYIGRYYQNKVEPDDNSAIKSFRQAIEICENLVLEDVDDLALCYFEFGKYYNNRQNYGLSRNYFDKALEIRVEILDPTDQSLGLSYTWLGISTWNAGDINRAQKYLERANDIFENNSDYSPISEWITYNGLANTYFTLEEFENARPLYEKAISIGSESGNPQTLIIPMNNLASTYAYTGRGDTANILFRKAIDININSERIEKFELYASYVQMGDYFSKEEQFDSALLYFEKSIEIIDNIGFPLPVSKAQTYSYIAKLEALRKDFIRGFLLIQKGIIELEPDFDDSTIFSNPNISRSFNQDFLYQLLEVKAEIFYLKYLQEGDLRDLEESQKLYLMVNDIAEDIRNGPFNDLTKILLSKSFNKTASGALKVIHELHEVRDSLIHIEAAYDFMEKNRYAELFSNVSKLRQVADTGIIPDSVYDNEQDIIFQIDNTRYGMMETTSDSIKATLTEELIVLESQYDDLKKNILIQYPEYYQESMVSLSQIQQELDDQTLLLEYFWGDSLLYLISLQKDSSGLASIKITKELEENISSFQRLISTPDLERNRQDMYKEYSILANTLFNRLLNKYLDPKIDKIILSLDGPLSLIPFEALLTTGSESNFSTADYLVRTYDIQYIYSTNVWIKNRAKDLTERPQFLAFSYSNGEEEAVTDSRDGMDDILSTAEEVKAIKSIFKKSVEIFSGAVATETKFKKLAPNFNIIHLAVHGIGDTQNSNNSRLIFKDSDNADDDGSLYAHELYNIPFNQLRLAVLSACESGIGKDHPGEGIFSMARGFTYAGCPSTIMSLWKANDQLTAQLMTNFYKNLKKGLTTSQALRMAKIEYLEENSGTNNHPSFWAAMVPLGDSRPIVNQKQSYLWFIVILVVILSSFIYLVQRKKLLSVITSRSSIGKI